MITNFEEYTHDLTPEELEQAAVLATVLRFRVGKDKAITNGEIQKGFREKLGVTMHGARVRKLIRHLRMSGTIPLLMSTSKGYYQASTKEEFNTCIVSIQERAESLYHLVHKMRQQLQHCEFDKKENLWTPNAYKK